jgi:hypothetical protein
VSQSHCLGLLPSSASRLVWADHRNLSFPIREVGRIEWLSQGSGRSQ